MKYLLTLCALLLAMPCYASSLQDQPRLYLLSISGIHLNTVTGERIEQISVQTFGVTFKALCHLPPDWEMTVGSMGTSGVLTGQAGHGTSFLGQAQLGELHNLALIELYPPVRAKLVAIPDGVIPATFSGYVETDSWTDGQEHEVRRQLTPQNFELIPANKCP